MVEMVMERLLGKLGRQCYAVLCLGVVLVSVTIARYVCAEAADHATAARALRYLMPLIFNAFSFPFNYQKKKKKKKIKTHPHT